LASDTSTTTTMGGASGLAGRYAAALYALADDNRELDAVIADTERLRAVIRDSDMLRRLLASPVVDRAEQRTALLRVLEAEGIGRTVRNLAGVVASNGRLGALDRIAAAFLDLVARRRGVQTAEVVTATPLTDTQRAGLLARLTESGYGSVRLTETVDPGILGGLVVKIGARLYDTSLRSRLQRLTYAMKGAA
jgi:F-type H+-transporting ATPase subunit delta